MLAGTPSGERLCRIARLSVGRCRGYHRLRLIHINTTAADARQSALTSALPFSRRSRIAIGISRVRHQDIKSENE